MKKLLSLAALLLAVSSSSYGIISNVSETSRDASFDFFLFDTAVPGNVSDTHVFSVFEGNSVTLTFTDRIRGFLAYDGSGNPFDPSNYDWISLGNIEELTTDPSSFSIHSYNVNSGTLNFGGNYLSGGSLVTWSVESEVKEELGFDLWQGTFTAHVPDTGSSLAFLGLGVLALVGLRRRFAR